MRDGALLLELSIYCAYPMRMQSLRRFRKLVVLAALVWLPMTVFAQICATHALLAHIGGPQHPALVAPEEMSVTEAARAESQPPLVVVDSATFWQSVDDYDSGCDMKSMCAFAAMAALMSSTSNVTFVNNTSVPLLSEVAFSTRALTPDTPPPRL
jgi:hypothetical protein